MAAGQGAGGSLAVGARLRGDGRGATVVEFALLMAPFFILVFGLFEVGLVIWGGLELDNATTDAARLVRTGQAQSADFDEARLRQEVCSRVALLRDCASRLRLEVRTFPSFASMTPAAPLDAEGKLRPGFAFQPGGPEAIVLMSAFYEWPLLGLVSNISLGNMAGGNRLLWASTAFRNEPFPEAGP
jgi:Flp pilus assembly protein TadG